MSGSLEVWIASMLTLMVFSFLWRDNPLYKFAEHLFVGVSAAYFMVLAFWSTLWPNAVLKLVPAAVRVTQPGAEPGKVEPLAIVPVVLGLLMLCRLWPRLAWLSRWPTAFAIGTTAGYNLTRYLRTDFLNQISNTVQDGIVVQQAGRVAWGGTLDQLLILAGTVCGLVHFTYSRRHRGFYGGLARIGVAFMMVTFGASFGYAVMGRVAVLVSRLQELLGGWLGLL
jgi:hypothetical protein